MNKLQIGAQASMLGGWEPRPRNFGMGVVGFT